MHWLRLISISILLGTPVPAGSAIFGKDDRVTVAPQPNSPYAPIGIVSIGLKRATGFLVSECHVLTVKHIFGDDAIANGRRLAFRAVLAAGRVKAPSSGGTVVAAGEFSKNDVKTRWHEGRSRDWILLRLDQCLGRSVGYVKLAKSVPRLQLASGQTVVVVQSAGFPAGRSTKALTVDPSCLIRARAPSEWLHDCAILRGNSGSPLFRKVRSDDRLRLEVFGMVTSGGYSSKPVPYSNHDSNRATPIDDLLVQIRQTMQPNSGHASRQPSEAAYNALFAP